MACDIPVWRAMRAETTAGVVIVRACDNPRLRAMRPEATDVRQRVGL